MLYTGWEFSIRSRSTGSVRRNAPTDAAIPWSAGTAALPTLRAATYDPSTYGAKTTTSAGLLGATTRISWLSKIPITRTLKPLEAPRTATGKSMREAGNGALFAGVTVDPLDLAFQAQVLGAQVP